LASVVLQMCAAGVTDITNFNFIDRPPKEALRGAVEQLKLLQALQELPSGELKLTERGRRLSAFPLDPRLAAVLLAADELGCAEEAVTAVSMLCAESVLLSPPNQREAVIVARKKFHSNEGDHVTMVKVFRGWHHANEKGSWCKQHFVHSGRIKFVAEVRRQLMEVGRRLNMSFQSSTNAGHHNYESLRRAFSRGLFTSVARLTREGHYVTLDSRQKAQIHPSSVLRAAKPEIVIFTELVVTQKAYLRDITLVDAAWLCQDQPDYFRKHQLFGGEG
jgi:ATP-dependent RNA helicase DHX33